VIFTKSTPFICNLCLLEAKNNPRKENWILELSLDWVIVHSLLLLLLLLLLLILLLLLLLINGPT
jgi:hypothetical protein